MTETETSPSGPLLLFDGECGLCGALMRFVLHQDRGGRIKVAALQGQTGQALLRRVGLPTEDFESLVFFPDCSRPEFLLRTDGVVAVAQLLPAGWARLGRFLGWFPGGFRDAGYRLVARCRHRIFGPPDPDGLSGPEFVDRVLD